MEKIKEKRIKYSFRDYINGKKIINDENSENMISER